MRVLHILASNKYSGAENVACQIINMFKNNIDMAYCSPKGEVSKILESKNITYFPIEKLNSKNIKIVIENYKPDIIHCHDLRAISICASIKGVRKIAHIHVNHPKMSKLSIRSIIAKFMLKKYNHIYWVSDSCFNDFKFHNGFSEQSTILPNIIDIDDLYDKVDVTKKTYIYDIVYCGRLTYQKNPLRILDIVELLKKNIPNIKLVVCGTGELYNQFDEERKKRNLDNNVTMLGFVNSPFDIMFHSKLMILTSHFEGTPMTALESLALGVPIVSTNIDGMKKIIKNGQNGFLYNTNDEASEIILNLIKNNKKLLELKNGAVDFSRQYNDEEMYKQTLLTYYKD